MNIKIYLVILVVVTLLSAAGVMLVLKDHIVPSVPSDPGVVGWREDFDCYLRNGLPCNWELRKKPGTPPAEFHVVRGDEAGSFFLRAEADKASSSLMYALKDVDLETTPVLRWRWRAEVLPAGADGRYRDRDDQALGIYAGTGSMLNNKSISYRWDTDTPKGSEGFAKYGNGIVKTKWFTLRNEKDSVSGKWFVEERNIAEDFKKAWGYYPKKLYIGISSNSQYTGGMAVAEIDWMELVSKK